MKNVKKIYVCSPYTELKEIGDGDVRAAALASMKSASTFYADERVELFSPVLTNMYTCEHLSHDEAMKVCFNQLKSCDEIFISAGGNSMREIMFALGSKGIKMEYEFAKENGIKVSFGDIYFRFIYEKELAYAKA
ncbi:DUF4406 domain-containing protein [Campylobacter sp. RM16192]|uniref:DUF4406 domain-containing protein n=1 Tax=Campylobacter sp. RM16192 TaxID=1660080 RepID=UPI001451DE52|nr:DUF4406 domain-containing protein [Campylobacter sp. RM16192]QCD52482.1 hypothetical protein CDOMC_0859 [Campylobacter sp. RM16192]